MQQVNGPPASGSPHRSVAGREYLTAAKAGLYWQLLLADDKPRVRVKRQPKLPAGSRLVLDDDEPEAVLSTRTDWTELPVAALTIPMMSVVDPVIAAGFEFAIIEDDGDVVFHSDPQRNTYENLFEEPTRIGGCGPPWRHTFTSTSTCCTRAEATVPT